MAAKEVLISGYLRCQRGAMSRGPMAMARMRMAKGARSQKGGGAPISIRARITLLGCRELIAGSSLADGYERALL
jgi:hypothetical protein